MPRSVRVMRTVAGVGVAIAVIALVLALSIGRGFEKVYRKSLLDFNAHVVIMGAGEIEDPESALAGLKALAFRDERDRQLAERWGWVAQVADAIASMWTHVCDVHLDGYRLFRPGTRLSSLWDTLDPSGWSALVPRGVISRVEALRAAAERGVIAENAFLYREALVIGKGGIKGAVVKGIEPGKYGSTGSMRLELLDGAGNADAKLKRAQGGVIPAIMGRALAQSMGIGQGIREVSMLIPKDVASAPDRRFERIAVIGTFESGMHDYDSQFMLMNIDDARKLFGVAGKTVTGIELRIDDPDKAGLVAAAAERELGPRYRAITWQELNADLLSAVRLEKFVTTLIMGIMLVVAALNIIAALVLTTLHRMREISVLKALGLSDERVQKLFIRGGLRVGMKGVLAGMAVGLLISVIIQKFEVIPLEAEIYLVGALPIDISWLICGIITLFCAGTIYFTSWIAAARLSRVPPAEGLARAR